MLFVGEIIVPHIPNYTFGLVRFDDVLVNPVKVNVAFNREKEDIGIEITYELV